MVPDLFKLLLCDLYACIAAEDWLANFSWWRFQFSFCWHSVPYRLCLMHWHLAEVTALWGTGIISWKFVHTVVPFYATSLPFCLSIFIMHKTYRVASNDFRLLSTPKEKYTKNHYTLYYNVFIFLVFLQVSPQNPPCTKYEISLQTLESKLQIMPVINKCWSIFSDYKKQSE